MLRGSRVDARRNSRSDRCRTPRSRRTRTRAKSGSNGGRSLRTCSIKPTPDSTQCVSPTSGPGSGAPSGAGFSLLPDGLVERSTGPLQRFGRAAPADGGDQFGEPGDVVPAGRSVRRRSGPAAARSPANTAACGNSSGFRSVRVLRRCRTRAAGCPPVSTRGAWGWRRADAARRAPRSR